MKITVKVKTGASKNEVKKVEDGEFEVFTTAIPEKGKANKSVIDLLAEYFAVAKTRVNIVAGHTSRVKIIEIQ